jgi:hypothetical protein
MLQHVSIIIQIIFRELISSLLESLNLKVFISFLKLWTLFVVMWQHNIWCVCVCVAFRVERYAGIQHTSPHRTPRTHIKRYAAALPQITSTILKKLIKTFKFSDSIKEPTSSLKMI